jgi:hypothetical protein
MAKPLVNLSAVEAISFAQTACVHVSLQTVATNSTKHPQVSSENSPATVSLNLELGTLNQKVNQRENKAVAVAPFPRCLLCAFPLSPAKHSSAKAFFGFVPFVLFRDHPA